MAEVEPGRDTIAAIVSALRRITLEDLSAEQVFELSSEESGPWNQRAFEQFIRTTRTERVRTAALIEELERIPRERWGIHMKSRQPSEELVRMLVLAGRRYVSERPAHADALLAIAIDLAQALTTERQAYKSFLLGRARLERANVLRQLGLYRDALSVLDEAERDFEGVPMCSHELARAWFVRGSLLLKIDGLEEARRALRRAISLFSAVADHRRVAKAQAVEGMVLADMHRYADARELWLTIIPVLRAGQERQTLGIVWLSLAWCELELGSGDAARTWLTKAMDIFTKTKDAVNLIHVRWAFAVAEARFGERKEGLRLLRRERAEFEKLTMFTDGGMVSLDIVEALLLMDEHEEAARVCREAIDLFLRAGARKEVVRALTYLREAAATSAAPTDAVKHVRREMRRAEREQDAFVFHPPLNGSPSGVWNRKTTRKQDDEHDDLEHE